MPLICWQISSETLNFAIHIQILHSFLSIYKRIAHSNHPQHSGLEPLMDYIHSPRSYQSMTETPIYRPREDDDRTALLPESWIQLHRYHPLVGCSPLSDEISLRRFNRAVYVIAATYAQIRIKTRDVSVILEDESCLRALFKFAYVLVSFHFVFFSIKAYEDVMKNILGIASNPTLGDVSREEEFMCIADSLTKNLDLGNCKLGEFEQISREVFDLTRDPIESMKRKERLSALNILYDKDIILPKKKKGRINASNTLEAEASSSSCRAVLSLASDEFPSVEVANVVQIADMGIFVPNIDSYIRQGVEMFENDLSRYTAQMLEFHGDTLSEMVQNPQLQESEPDLGDNLYLTKLKWILRILKHMEFKDHVFSSSNEFIVPEFAGSKVEKGGAPKNLDRSDPELIFRLMETKLMTRHHQLMKEQLSAFVPLGVGEVEFSGLIDSFIDSTNQLKTEMHMKFEELSGKIEFCMKVYEGTKVEEKLKIFYEKRSKLLLDLSLDTRFCCNFVSLPTEMASDFKKLLDELEVINLADE